MTKWELIALRRTIYELAGTIGHHAELTSNTDLVNCYAYMSSALDSLENHGYNQNWIDISTNEVIEDISLPENKSKTTKRMKL